MKYTGFISLRNASFLSLASVAKGIIYEFMGGLLREVDDQSGGEIAGDILQVKHLSFLYFG